jgi:hypothetical protein
MMYQPQQRKLIHDPLSIASEVSKAREKNHLISFIYLQSTFLSHSQADDLLTIKGTESQQIVAKMVIAGLNTALEQNLEGGLHTGISQSRHDGRSSLGWKTPHWRLEKLCLLVSGEEKSEVNTILQVDCWSEKLILFERNPNYSYICIFFFFTAHSYLHVRYGKGAMGTKAGPHNGDRLFACI